MTRDSKASSAPSTKRLTASGTYALFLISGIAALIYEIVWMRNLTFTFGAGVYAVSAVVAAYMAGLALGAVVGGRAATRTKSPFGLYAAIEILIGLCGAMMPALFERLHDVDVWVVRQWGQNFEMLVIFRFVLSFGLMLVPTVLMGATLPVLAQGLISRQNHLGRRVGALYAANTIGAMAGAFLGGFWLLRSYGTASTESAAVFLNLCAGAGGFVLWRRERTTHSASKSPAFADEGVSGGNAATDSDQQMVGRPDVYPAVLMSVFAVGLSALAAQVLWSRMLVYYFDSLKSTTYGISALLTVFLGGLALGSAFGGWMIDRIAHTARVYGVLLYGLGAAIALSVPLLIEGGPIKDRIDPETMTYDLSDAVRAAMLRTVTVIGLPTFLMGLCFPVAVKSVSSVRNVGRRIGGLYFANTVGAVAGAVLASFAVVPLFGLTRGLIVLGIPPGVCGLGLLWKARMPLPWQCVALLSFAGAMTCSGFYREPEFVHLDAGDTLLFYDEGVVATVSVVENQRGERRVNVDDIPVAGTSLIMQTDQKSLAHVPLALVKSPRSVLTVGFGSGGASWSYLLHDELECVDCVEISPEVVEAARYLTDANHGLLEDPDPRYRIVFDDARAYLRYTDKAYDVIATDCTDLRYKSSANLYDFEYFQSCRSRLSDDGVVVVWMPLGGLSDDMFRATLRTFQRVFPEMSIHYMHNTWTHYILLVGFNRAIAIDFRRVEQMLREDDVRRDLAEIGLSDPYKLLATFVTAGVPLGRMIEGNLVNTQDHPILEFEAPKFAAGPELAQRNLETLMRFRTSVLPWVVRGSMTESQRQSLRRFELAAEHIIRGQHLEHTFQIEAATREFLTAQQWTPEDEGIDRLLKYEWLRSLGQQNNPTAWLLLGRSDQIRGRTTSALANYGRFWDTLERISKERGGEIRKMQAQGEAWSETARLWQNECLRQRPPGAGADGAPAETE